MTLLTPLLIILVVAALVGLVWLFSPAAALQAAISVGVIACMGISTGILGELLPAGGSIGTSSPLKHTPGRMAENCTSG